MSSIVVLAGGTSNERDVSLRSGASIQKALQQAGHLVTLADTTKGITGLLPTLRKADVIFPALHGSGGEDGLVQKFLEDNNILYVGSDSKASALCFDKWRYKQVLITNALPVPRGELVDETTFWQSPLNKHPFILKPNDGGSSIDNLLSYQSLVEVDKFTVRELFGRHNKMLLEGLIIGTEITVAVVGQRSLPVIEIIPPIDQTFNYENKYNGSTQELCPPQHVSQELQAKAQKLAAHIHHLMGCRDMSRTDFMINQHGQLFILETNTIPGLTDQSLLPKAAAVAGLSMAKLCDNLIQMALGRRSGN